MSHEAAIAAAGGRFLGEAHGTVWFTDPETQSTLALPAEDVTADVVAITLLRSRRSFRQEQFRLLIEGLQDYAIFMLDQHGNIVSWNSGAERIFGYAPQEIIGQPVSTLYFPEDQRSGKARQMLNLAALEGRYEAELWKRRKDGSGIWGDVLITALRDEAGQVRGYSLVCRDVTRRFQEQKRQTVRLCVTRTLAEASGSDKVVPLFFQCVCKHLDWDRAEYWEREDQRNCASLRAYGSADIDVSERQPHASRYHDIPLAEVLPEHVWAAFHPVLLQHSDEDLTTGSKCFEQDPMRTVLVLPLRNQHEVRGWVLFGHRLHREPNEKEIDIIEDLSHLLNRYLQQESAETQLQALTRRMQEQAGMLDRILNASPDLIVMIDQTGRYTYANPQAASLLGVEPSFMIGKTPWDLGLPRERIEKLELERIKVMESGQASRSETSFPTTSGLLDFEYILSPVRDSEGAVKAALATARDITERKRVEDRLRVMLEQLPAILWTTDVSSRFTSSLGAGLRLLGLNPNEVVGMSLDEFCKGQPFEDVTLEAHEKALQGQRIAYRTAWRHRILDVWVQPLRRIDGSIDGTIGLALDITEQNIAEAVSKCELSEELAQPPLEMEAYSLVHLQKHLDIAAAILVDLLARPSQPGQREHQEELMRMADALQRVLQQVKDRAGSTSRSTTDAA